MVACRSWTPYTLPQYKPKPPVHYKTLGETFSYVPPMRDDVREVLEREGMIYQGRQLGTLPVPGKTL
jgi:hypothetical protein